MSKTIVVKTDASVSATMGVGLGYEAVVYDGDGGYTKHSDSKYIPDHMKTTDAETVAAAFAVKEIYHKMNGDRDQYELIVETDCEKTVDDVRESVNEEQGKTERVLNFFAEGFHNMKIRWISRSNNKRVDAIAKSAVERGWEEL